ncbi:DDE Tnp4 domain-containing protein [Aphis craccivora]|uniref:DDE Tnp4 domain-containing protein n=1 Tax=Aphis craccivora TaxID=307492 RepID=A0A6G0YCL3_APHCR|nr:DDE Tnp4 domain-containing protein [Aphis craccivora]
MIKVNIQLPVKYVILCKKIKFERLKSSVQRIFHFLNFKYKKCSYGRKFLIERNDKRYGVTLESSFKENVYFTFYCLSNDSRPVIY